MRLLWRKLLAASAALVLLQACGDSDDAASDAEPPTDGSPDGAPPDTGDPGADAAPDDAITYAVGEEGPAGGTIFYVDEDDNEAFDYLEAAPAGAAAETELAQPADPSLRWHEEASYVSGTDGAFGSGPENTAAILEVEEAGPQAARAADDLEVGGYDDWFLPSLNELDELHEALHQEGLGGFANDVYWSSTAQMGPQGPYYAIVEDFDPEGDLATSQVTSQHRVRPIRAGTIEDDGS